MNTIRCDICKTDGVKATEMVLGFGYASLYSVSPTPLRTIHVCRECSDTPADAARLVAMGEQLRLAVEKARGQERRDEKLGENLAQVTPPPIPSLCRPSWWRRLGR